MEELKQLVEEINSIVGKQKGGELCPRCRKNILDKKLHRNALSRYIDLYICSECGVEEALIDIFKSKFEVLRNWKVLNKSKIKYMYSYEVMEAVRQNLGLEPDDTTRDEYILNLPRRTVFMKFLAWYGIIGYDSMIKRAIEDIYCVQLIEND